MMNPSWPADAVRSLRLRDLPFEALEVPEPLFELDLGSYRDLVTAVRLLVVSAS